MNSWIKKIFFHLKWINLFWMLPIIAEPLKLDLKGDSVLLINADTGHVLYEKEAHVLRYPASTTKIATAIYALKQLGHDLNRTITAEQEALATITPEAKRKANYKLPSYWLETDGTHIGIKKGEILTFHDLLRGMMIPSGNDASNVIAQTVGKSILHFMDELNLYLKEMGCQQTHFCNPHGLHHPEHHTTAYDLALITREALKNSIFLEIINQPRFMRPKTNKQAATTLLQGNRLLRPGKFYYKRAIGVKTGYHAKAKHTFVAAAKENGRTLIAVLLGYQHRSNMFEDAIKLFDAAFNQPKVKRQFLKAGNQNFTLNLPKANQPLQTYLATDLSLEYYPAENPNAKCFLNWQPLALPILKDQQVGEIHLISTDGYILKKVPLLALTPVNFAWPHFWFVNFSFYWLLIGGMVILCCIIGYRFVYYRL